MEQSGNRIFALRAEKCQEGIFSASPLMHPQEAQVSA
jgi:hypothetical protein